MSKTIHTPLYFGCHRVVGHYYWLPGMRHGNSSFHACKWLHFIDGLFTRPDGREGVAELVYIWDYTILAFADYSVDTRPGSNSAFVLEGYLEFGDALNRAKIAFPEVFARFKFEVRRLPLA